MQLWDGKKACVWQRRNDCRDGLTNSCFEGGISSENYPIISFQFSTMFHSWRLAYNDFVARVDIGFLQQGKPVDPLFALLGENGLKAVVLLTGPYMQTPQVMRFGFVVGIAERRKP